MHSVPLTSIHQYMYDVFPLCGNGHPPKGEGRGGGRGGLRGYTPPYSLSRRETSKLFTKSQRLAGKHWQTGFES